VINPDSQALESDPGKIALGDAAKAAAAAENPNPQGPACSASLSAFQSALLFKNIFTAIVALLALLTVGALGFCLVRVIVESWEPANTLAAITAVVTGGGALYLGRERSKSQKILDGALGDVQRYCGAAVHDQLT